MSRILTTLIFVLTNGTSALASKVPGEVDPSCALTLSPSGVWELERKNRSFPTNPRDMAILAQEEDYKLEHDPQDALRLIAFGVARSRVVEFIRPMVEKDLENVESITNTRMIMFSPTLKRLPGNVPHSLDPRRMTLDQFEAAYDLEESRKILSDIVMGPNGSHWQVADRTLRAALIIGDKQLISRAMSAALRFGRFDELTAIVAELGNSETLFLLGKLSIARYLFLDRNHNWLNEGLRALTETTGDARAQAQALIYDLFDLVNSSEILAHEDKVLMYGEKGKEADYHEAAIDVLTATQNSTRRLLADSSARFDYLRERTDDPAYVNRFFALYQKMSDGHENVYRLIDAAALLKDRGQLLRLADQALEASKHGSGDTDHAPRSHAVLSFMATVFSGDRDAIRGSILGFLHDPNYNRHNRPFVFLGSEVNYVSADVVEQIRSYVRAPETLEAGLKSDELQNLAKFLNNIDYEREKQAKEPRAGSKILYTPQFSHEVDMIDHALNHPRKESGDQLLAAEKLWDAYLAYTAARNVEGLRKTYEAMMTYGRPIDAVYVAIALETIESGRVPPELTGAQEPKKLGQ